jgi:hypothetical protein
MPLRKRLKDSVAASTSKGEGKKSKRQKILDFFKHRKHKPEAGKNDAVQVRLPLLSSHLLPMCTLARTAKLMAFRSKIPVVSVPTTKQDTAALKPDQSTSNVDISKPAKSNGSATVGQTSSEKEDQAQLPTPPPEAQEKLQVQILSEEQIHTLFSGAPHFVVGKTEAHPIPRALFPWDNQLTVKDVSDSQQLAHPAFSAATLRRHLPALQQSSDQDKPYLFYDVGIVEAPSMLSAQGVEPGTIGFVHFLELPISDSLVTDLQQSQSSNGYLESVRNKEQMHTNPERLGIRKVDLAMLHDRLLELGDLVEVFQDSPQRMTLLNNQSSGDLYANLFGKFLTPPGYDDDSADDPTGMKVQINTLCKILRLKGVWYDFSLVEWRIRLGQILWSDSATEELDESPTGELWSPREILLLQITLACELLLRLDAITSMDPDEVKSEMHVDGDDLEGFLKLKTRKVDWDLVLARRFLDNIVIVPRRGSAAPADTSKGLKLLSMLSKDGPKTSPEPEMVLLSRHQARQLSGLVCFAETLRWPGVDELSQELAQKLGVPNSPTESDQSASSQAKYLDPNIASPLSVYGTPLATPRSARDSYFGNVSRPPVERSHSQRLTVPLTTTAILPSVESPGNTSSIGGWLSRSFLTGLILPGEAISHFLMSTLLENDRAAITALGDSANLYGGFVYGDRSWWSKNCIVGRVVACLEGAVECLGWISVPKVPEGLPDGWYAIGSRGLQNGQPLRISAEEDLVLRDSAIVEGGIFNNVKAEELTLPLESSTPPVPSVVLSVWSLTPITPGLPEADGSSGVQSETEAHMATLTFASLSRGMPYDFNLTYDVQFVTSFPCTPPAKTPPTSLPEILKSSLSRSSSKRSMHSTKSGSKRLSRFSSRRNSHGFEPLFSHPPDSPSIAPLRVHSPIPDEEEGEKGTVTVSEAEPMMAHPLHASYKFKIVPVTDVLDANFVIPFTHRPPASPGLSDPGSPSHDENQAETKTVLVLDARNARDLELLARSWCAEKGFNALIGRVGRTCLACCIREARGLGINVVIRV